jgi:Fic family protein
MAPTRIWQQPDWPLGTAAIEGEQLDPGQVRSSIARRFGLALADGQPQASAQVEGLLDVLLAASGELHQALTLATLHQWHRRLFADGPDGLRAIRIGELRGNAPMQVLSGPIGRERLHFGAPARTDLETQLEELLAWIAQPPADLDGLWRAALVHFWIPFATAAASASPTTTGAIRTWRTRWVRSRAVAACCGIHTTG